MVNGDKMESHFDANLVETAISWPWMGDSRFHFIEKSFLLRIITICINQMCFWLFYIVSFAFSNIESEATSATNPKSLIDSSLENQGSVSPSNKTLVRWVLDLIFTLYTVTPAFIFSMLFSWYFLCSDKENLFDNLEFPKLVSISLILMTFILDSRGVLSGEIRRQSFLGFKGLSHENVQNGGV